MGLEVRASAEDYLEAILLLQRRMGVVRSVDVAQHLEVSKPSDATRLPLCVRKDSCEWTSVVS